MYAYVVLAFFIHV